MGGIQLNTALERTRVCKRSSSCVLSISSFVFNIARLHMPSDDGVAHLLNQGTADRPMCNGVIRNIAVRIKKFISRLRLLRYPCTKRGVTPPIYDGQPQKFVQMCAKRYNFEITKNLKTFFPTYPWFWHTRSHI